MIRETILEYSTNEFLTSKVDDSVLNSCEIKICPILLLELILAKVRGNPISFSACKQKEQLSIVSELSYEIWTLERMINSSDVPEPSIIDRIQDLKDRLEVEVEKEDLEREPIRPLLR